MASKSGLTANERDENQTANANRRWKVLPMWRKQTGDSSTFICRMYLDNKSEGSTWDLVGYLNTKKTEVTECLKWIRGRDWKQYKKEIAIAIWGARIYHTWRARNWKLFTGTIVNTEITIRQIKKKILERVDYPKDRRKASKCRYLVQKLCN